MFRLTREVRFSINDEPETGPVAKPSNSYGGFPSMTGLGRFYTAAVTLAGPLQADSQYLLNIKEVDDAVRTWLAEGLPRPLHAATPAALLRRLADHLHRTWPEQFAAVALHLTPTLMLTHSRSDPAMLRLSQTFEFSASHRLHNPALSDEQNRQLFGKCNNPLGHGHNYEVQVSIIAPPATVDGTIAGLPEFERLVDETVISRFDHKHLNLEVPEFAETNPSVENIAKVIYALLKPRVATLGSVTVWETPKTWCEYSE